MEVTLGFWIGFFAFVLFMFALDLGLFHRKAHIISFKEACIWSAVWVTLALLFCGGVYWYAGEQKALEFLTGYVIEYSLSIDNVFVFVLIFSFFGVPMESQYRVLLWGISLALVLRLILILVGVALIQQFEWIIYVFGLFLVITGAKMLVSSDKPKDLSQNPVLKISRRLFEFSDGYDGSKFFTIQDGKKLATPLMLVFIMVAISDVIFAVDSIPAILAITHDSFIVFTSNAFAILGLRSMFFMLASVLNMFRFLKVGLSLVLMFVGIKMLLGHTAYSIPIHYSLMTVIGILAVSIILSILIKKPEDEVRI